MRLALLADIHGNLPALQAVLTDLGRFAPDGLIAAGDYLALPWTEECLAVLRSYPRIWMIQGNGEIGALQYADGTAPPEWGTHRQFALARWLFERLSPDSLAFLRSLPEQRVVAPDGCDPIRVFHGSPRSAFESIFPGRPETLDLAFELTDEPVFVCGHTHQPWVSQRGGRLGVNPGSVAAPLNGFVGAQYALLDWVGSRWQASLRAVTYDVRLATDGIRASGMLAECGAFARTLIRGLETGQDVAMAFLSYARGLAQAAGYGKSGAIPDEIWERAEAQFDWDRNEWGNFSR